DKLIQSFVGEAVKSVFLDYADPGDLEPVITHFADRDNTIEIGDDVSTAALATQVAKASELKKAAVKMCVDAELAFENEAILVAAAEFILEALYVNNRLSKYAYHGKTIFKR
ncbi:MAG: hypothetical protein ACPGXK_14825, partial [Phycisphaerae bacterium]